MTTVNSSVSAANLQRLEDHTDETAPQSVVAQQVEGLARSDAAFVPGLPPLPGLPPPPAGFIPGLPPPPPLPPGLGGDPAAAQRFFDFFKQALGDLPGLPGGGLPPMDQISAADLVAAFMKLNILDPNASTDTQNLLGELANQLRQQAIAAAKKMIEQAKQQLEKAEKKQKAMGPMFMFVMMINPMLAIHMMMAGSMKVKVAKAKLERAEKLLEKLTAGDGMSKELREKIERDQQAAIAELKQAIASAGEDGVPTKGIAKSLKPGVEHVLGALTEIGQSEGLSAMLAVAPQALTQELVPMLEQAGVADAEKVAEEVAALYIAELLAGFSSDDLAGVETELSSAVAGLGGRDDEEGSTASAIQEWAALSAQTQDGRITG